MLTEYFIQAMASNFYREPDSPRYILGHGLELAFVCAGIVAAIILNIGYLTINKKRDKKMAEMEAAGEHGGLVSQELSELGDKAYTFRYMH